MQDWAALLALAVARVVAAAAAGLVVAAAESMVAEGAAEAADRMLRCRKAGLVLGIGSGLA